MKKLLALIICTLGFAASAQAAYIPASWDETLTFNRYIGHESSYDYQHDITNDGFRPLEDIATNFYLTINLSDDQGYDSGETAYVDLPGWTSNSYVTTFGLSGAEYGGWSILGLLELNVFGTLSVTIESITGDFRLLNSTIVANGYRNTDVPEPGALGLLGIGLLGMALSLRRRKTA